MNASISPALNHTLNWEEALADKERLSFCLFLALVFHLILILGLGFEAFQKHSIPPTLEITLAKYISPEEPVNADFLAQHNQEASGTVEEQRELTTDQLADFSDTDINFVQPTPKVQATVVETVKDKQLISTTHERAKASPQQLEENRQQQAEVVIGEESSNG